MPLYKHMYAFVYIGLWKFNPNISLHLQSLPSPTNSIHNINLEIILFLFPILFRLFLYVCIIRKNSYIFLLTYL